MRILAWVALATILTACAGTVPATETAPPLVPIPAAGSTLTPIKHVVIIVQENRSFENIFAGYPGAIAPMYGYSSLSGTTKIPLLPWGFTQTHTNGPPHGWIDAILEYNKGAMNGWSLDPASPDGLFKHLPRSEVAPYWTMAREYALADHMFPTEFGPSFTGHLDLISGDTYLTPSTAIVDIPHSTNITDGWGCKTPPNSYVWTVDSQKIVDYNPGPRPCFTQFHTMADSLDAAKVSWRYYAPEIGQQGGIWSEFSAIKNVYYGPDWKKDVVSPQTRVLSDAHAGLLPSVTWVIPDARDSDHAAAKSPTGPSWVGSVVNAIGEGKDWDSTAIFIVWDDWGGWYDNLPPPQPWFAGLGIRVPCIIVSPYARHGYVSHTTYEFGSLLHFIENTFNVPALGTVAEGYSDERAVSPSDAFDFKQRPAKFKPIPVPYPESFFLTAPPSRRPPDDDL